MQIKVWRIRSIVAALGLILGSGAFAADIDREKEREQEKQEAMKLVNEVVEVLSKQENFGITRTGDEYGTNEQTVKVTVSRGLSTASVSRKLNQAVKETLKAADNIPSLGAAIDVSKVFQNNIVIRTGEALGNDIQADLIFALKPEFKDKINKMLTWNEEYDTVQANLFQMVAFGESAELLGNEFVAVVIREGTWSTKNPKYTLVLIRWDYCHC